MRDDLPLDFRTTDLDPLLLSTPFEGQTNWLVLAGAPSCGKTTLIDLLAGRDFRTIPETARCYMEDEVAAGRTIEDIHAHGARLQGRIADRQCAVESQLSHEDSVFLDGALPGSLAWYRVFGLDPNELLGRCFRHRYASVFILDRLPLDPDGLRFDNGAHMTFIDEWTERDYRALHYEVVRVPVMDPEQRLDFVLARLPADARRH